MTKRTEIMIIQDRAKVCELLARGYRNRSEMARIINQNRAEEFHISPNQVGRDIKLMEASYLERGFENLAIYRRKAMDELLYLLTLYYEGYEKSRVNKITVESMKSIDTPDEYDEIMEQAELKDEYLEGVHPFGRDGKIKEEYRGEGNPAFLNGAKGVLDSLNKIRGVDGATKVALTDPTGTEDYTGVAELMKMRMDELSDREAPNDTDKYLLEAMPNQESVEVEEDGEQSE